MSDRECGPLEDARQGRRVAVIARTMVEAREVFDDMVRVEAVVDVVRTAGRLSFRVAGGGSIRFFSLSSPEAMRGMSFDSVFATSAGVAARLVRDPGRVAAVLASARDPRFGVL